MTDEYFPATRSQNKKNDNPMGTGVLGIIAAICLAIFSVVLRFALEALDKLNYRKAARWFFLSVLPLGVAAILWSIHGDATMFEKNLVLGIIGAAIGASGFIYAGYALGDSIPRIQAAAHLDEPASADKLAQNVTSFGQQGGITAGTVNIGPQRLGFSSQLGAELLAKMPIKKKIEIQSIGGNLDQAVASEIQIFLQKNGYDVSRMSIGVMAPPPDSKISLSDTPNGYVLIIAPSAN